MIPCEVGAADAEVVIRCSEALTYHPHQADKHAPRRDTAIESDDVVCGERCEVEGGVIRRVLVSHRLLGIGPNALSGPAVFFRDPDEKP